CRYAHHYVYCNRGVNGIEGSLSTAAGFSLATNKRVYCVIGDLSFFYDQNALWNTRLRSNLHILLLNDGRGGIFHHLPGLEQSPALNDYIAASHHTSAQGICAAHNITYIRATDVRETETAVKRLFSDGDSNRPILVEIILSCKAG
ncbi:MAG: 2-succinyl-5-enolpyruvyl-6-hydroxy-3-cyclohexene-1-carboxylic-acid synthase, partial [Prevotella sp.]|nr:2-succinyl-5-enolpyruvyl-6-hydroxy-3-cyclohexene-1-carboxylic-acid synthase [Prevotella sp.]